MSLVLNIKERDPKAKFLGGENKVESQIEFIKGVMYGKKEESTPIVTSYNDFKKIWREARGSSLVTLKGVGEDKEAIIQDIAFDPVNDNPIHVDFYIIERGKTMEVEVPLEFIGVAPAVKELGGVLVKALHEIEIEVLPKDLPKSITVDVSSLKDFESRILAKDLVLPASGKLITDDEENVALVVPPEEEVEETGTADISSVEIEKKGKKEEETQ